MKALIRDAQTILACLVMFAVAQVPALVTLTGIPTDVRWFVTGAVSLALGVIIVTWGKAYVQARRDRARHLAACVPCQQRKTTAQ